MLSSGTDPESYITEHTSVHEDYTSLTSLAVSCQIDQSAKTSAGVLIRGHAVVYSP
jgi:hypothetical protein